MISANFISMPHGIAKFPSGLRIMTLTVRAEGCALPVALQERILAMNLARYRSKANTQTAKGNRQKLVNSSQQNVFAGSAALEAQDT